MVGLTKASSLFSQQDLDAIEQSIVSAEKNTSGEIVPVIASVSGRYDRAEDIVGLLFSLVCVSLGWAVFHNTSPANGWATINFGLAAILLTIFVGFIVGVLLSHLFPVIRLPFIAKRELEEEIDRAAAAAFQKNRLRNTQESTGILIYISLFEHQVRVIGDDGISAKLTHVEWAHICDSIVTNFKQKQYKDGIVEGVNLSGKLLAEYFPGKSDDEDELKNELVVID